MRKLQVAVGCAVMLAMLAVALPVSADPVAKSIELLIPAKVGRTQLDVGTYKILIDGNKVTVKQNNKVIAETTGEFVERPSKQTHNAVLVSRTGQLEEVRFAGDRRVLILNN